MNHSNLSPSDGLNRGMGAVPMAASDTPPTPLAARPLVTYLVWLGFIVAVFGVALYAIWSVSQ